MLEYTTHTTQSALRNTLHNTHYTICTKCIIYTCIINRKYTTHTTQSIIMREIHNTHYTICTKCPTQRSTQGTEPGNGSIQTGGKLYTHQAVETGVSRHH